MTRCNFIFILTLLLYSVEIVAKQNQYIIWVGGMMRHASSSQNVLPIDRAVTIYKRLRKKGVRPEHIHLNISGGLNTPVIRQSLLVKLGTYASIGGLKIGTFTDNESYYPTVSKNLKEHFKKNGVDIPDENVRQGTMKYLTEAFQEAGQKSDGGNLFLYTTSGKETVLGGDKDIGYSHGSLYSIETVDGEYYDGSAPIVIRDDVTYARYVKPIMDKYKRVEAVMGKIDSNENYMKELLSLSEKQLTAFSDNPYQLGKYLQETGYYNEIDGLQNGSHASTIRTLQKFKKLSNEERKEFYSAEEKRLVKEGTGMEFLKPQIFHGKGSVTRLINEYKKYNSDGKIVVFNDLSMPMTFAGSSRVFEYQSDLSSDRHGAVPTEAFIDGLMSGSVRDAIVHTEDTKSKNVKKYGRNGTTSLDHYIGSMKQKYYQASNVSSVEFPQGIQISDDYGEADLKEMVTMSIINEDGKLIMDSKNKKVADRKELKIKLMKLTGEYEGFVNLKNYDYMDYMTEKEANRVKDLIDCLKIRF